MQSSIIASVDASRRTLHKRWRSRCPVAGNFSQRDHLQLPVRLPTKFSEHGFLTCTDRTQSSSNREDAMKGTSAVSFAAVVALRVLFNTSEAGAAPIPIAQCGPINVPGAWVVTNNLDATGDCLLILASPASRSISPALRLGAPGLQGIGIAAPDSLRGIVVRNGTVTGFDYGIRLVSPDSTVTSVRAIRNVFGIFANGSLTMNTATENSFAGIAAVGGSIISGNAVQNGGNAGIIAGPGSQISGNVVTGNAGVGITVEEASTAASNSASSNGIGLNVFCPANIVGNTEIKNGQDLNLNGTDCVVSQNLPPASPPKGARTSAPHRETGNAPTFGNAARLPRRERVRCEPWRREGTLFVRQNSGRKSLCLCGS